MQNPPIRGRKKNPNFAKLNFALVKINQKYCARCFYCQKTLRNTAAARLLGHRNKCLGDIFHHIQPQQRLTVEGRECDDVGNQNVTSVADNASQNFAVFAANIKLEPNEQNYHDNLSEVNMAPNQHDISWSSQNSACSSQPSTSSPISQKKHFTGNSPMRQPIKRPKGSAYKPNDLLPPAEDQINDTLAKLIFGCNVPVSVIKSPLFKNFVKTLSPAYAERIPTSLYLNTTLLDKCYADTIRRTNRRITQSVVVLIDSWRNSSNNDSQVVVALAHSAGEKSTAAFIDAWELPAHADDQLADIMVDCQRLVRAKYNVGMYCLVSDQVDAMSKMAALSNQLWHCTCNSHLFRLFAEDVIDRTVMEHIALVMNAFKRPHSMSVCLEADWGQQVKVPIEGNWSSYRDSYSSFLACLPYMKRVTTTEKTMHLSLKTLELIFSAKFVESVQADFARLLQICDMIETCEKPETSIADAVHYWLTLDLAGSFEKELLERRTQALNVYAMSAYYFHPSYDNSELSAIQKNTVHMFLFKQLNNKGIEEWDAFNNQTGVFASLYEKDVRKPLLFWRMAKMECPELSTLVLKLLCIPASSSHSERLFADKDEIHAVLKKQSKKSIHTYFALQSENRNQIEVDPLMLSRLEDVDYEDDS